MAYQPTVYSNYFIAAKCEMLLGDNASAEGDFIRCLKCPNNNPEYDQVVYVDTCAEARYLLSKCYFHDGMYKPAAELALSAVKLHPDSALYRLQVARADVQLKQDKEAKSELTAALKIDPNLSEAKSLMTLLNEPAN
jgi:tetratricopeptide (TPR) repeat protein